MRLSEVEVVLNREYNETKTNENGWCVSIKRAEIKGNGVLKSIVAWGRTKQIARKELAKKLSGKTIVLNAYKTTRQEITLPETISGVM